MNTSKGTTRSDLPVWVTLREARFLTGLSDGTLQEHIDSGRVTCSQLHGKRGEPMTFVRTADLRLAGLLGGEPEKSSSPRATPTQTASESAGTSPPDRVPRSLRDSLSGLRHRRLPVMVAAVVVGMALIVSAAVVALRTGPQGRDDPAGAATREPPTSLAWGVRVDATTYVAVLALPGDTPAVAVGIPGDTMLDMPGTGGMLVADAATSGGSLSAAVQTALRRAVDHYLFSDVEHLQKLVDRLGGIEVILEVSFTYSGQPLGPGPAFLSGRAVGEYLRTATPEDAPGRWEGILAGLLAAPQDPAAWAEPLGDSDDPALAPRLLERAAGGQVVELPTVISEGGRRVDDEATADLIADRLGGIGGELIRVTVLNANGAPGIGAMVNDILAPAGFRVVASQNATSQSDVTQIVATSGELIPVAEQARRLLTVGEVFVGEQPTSVTDLIVVVGRDFPGVTPPPQGQH